MYTRHVRLSRRTTAKLYGGRASPVTMRTPLGRASAVVTTTVSALSRTAVSVGLEERMTVPLSATRPRATTPGSSALTTTRRMLAGSLARTRQVRSGRLLELGQTATVAAAGTVCASASVDSTTASSEAVVGSVNWYSVPTEMAERLLAKEIGCDRVWAPAFVICIMG